MTKSSEPKRYQDLFAERDAYLSTFQARRQALDSMVAAQRARRLEFETALAEELGATRAALAEVAPISADEVGDIPMRRAAYSDRMAAVMSKLALLAYVVFEDPQRREVLQTALEQAGLKLSGAWAVGSTESFMAEGPNFIAVIFRGTTSPQDKKTNFSFGARKVSVPGHRGEVLVHDGFYEAFRLVEPGIRAALSAADPGKPVFFTGHSLGGALALIASAAFSGEDALGARIAAVYTFGAPRVGSRVFERVVKAPHYRIVNEGDVVPLVPPNWILGYAHTGELMLLRRNQVRTVRARSWLSTAFLALGGLLSWPFTRQLMFLKRHAISLYASRLEVIAHERGKWS